ncbi:unnamed protein product [Ranitomeya imitator]|uniref:Uncharacterized protein n=1 Tax=Ranitomeya imitator TaxID=111125 RepID=A0ABN9KTM7_9NEOB|nr:unnamed protein product [Ranitomeya imitator]
MGYITNITLDGGSKSYYKTNISNDTCSLLGFFKVATFCFDDRFAHSWHSLDELQEVVTGNAFHFTVHGNEVWESPSCKFFLVLLAGKTSFSPRRCPW